MPKDPIRDSAAGTVPLDSLTTAPRRENSGLKNLAPPDSRSRRLTDPQAVQYLALDLKMIRAIRRIARGEPLLDIKSKRQLITEWRQRLADLGLPQDDTLVTILDLLQEAYRAGADSTLNPLPVVRAFESLVRVGHSKLWQPQDGHAETARNVQINIITQAEPKRIEAVPSNGKIIETTAVEAKP